jgi:stress response protein YsnF
MKTLIRSAEQLYGCINIRKKKDIENKIENIQKKIYSIRSGEREKKFDEKSEKYLRAYKWNLDCEKQLCSLKRRQIQESKTVSTETRPVLGPINTFTISNQNTTTRIAYKNANRLIFREYLMDFENQPPPSI